MKLDYLLLDISTGKFSTAKQEMLKVALMNIFILSESTIYCLVVESAKLCSRDCSHPVSLWRSSSGKTHMGTRSRHSSLLRCCPTTNQNSLGASSRAPLSHLFVFWCWWLTHPFSVSHERPFVLRSHFVNHRETSFISQNHFQSVFSVKQWSFMSAVMKWTFDTY